MDRFTTLWKLRWKLKTDPSERKIPFVHPHVQVSGEYLGPKVINGRIKVANYPKSSYWESKGIPSPNATHPKKHDEKNNPLIRSLIESLC